MSCICVISGISYTIFASIKIDSVCLLPSFSNVAFNFSRKIYITFHHNKKQHQKAVHLKF